MQGSSIMNSLNSSPNYNVKRNIIAGPNPMQYWNHSSGLETPLVREEGAFPIQGNIGSLLKQEATNYNGCDDNLPNISGSPNCTAASAFVPDVYTLNNTCGDNCTLQYPEAYGDQSFGLIKNDQGSYVITNAHGLHAYDNIRAAIPGSGPSSVYGCYEFIPNLAQTAGDSCMIDQYPAYQQIGDWSKIPESKNIVSYQYRG